MKRRRFLHALAAAPIGSVMSSPYAVFLNGNIPLAGREGVEPRLLDKASDGVITGQPLFIPPLYEGENAAGERNFDLFMQESVHEVLAGKETPTWVVNTAASQLPMLGPTLYLRRGDDVRINYTNGLPETTTMHGHGMAVPGPMDGGPHQRIAPGNTWQASYRVEQPACTNWYHPHEMEKTAEHVYHGLAGLIVIEDDVTDELPLPSTYAFDDIPLVVQDRRFLASGAFDYSPTNQEIRQGYFGDVILVNGQVQPHVSVPQGLVRLRLLNASNSDVWRFDFSDGRVFTVIAGDNGFLPKPVDVRSLVLSPAERAEIIVNFTTDRHARVALQVQGIRSGLNQVGVFLDVTAGYAPVTRWPSWWPESTFQPEPNAPLRTFDLGGQGGLRINGQQMNLNVINEQVPLGQTEIWRVRSTMGMMHHNFHIHGGGFHLLTRNGRADAVRPHEKGEKDTVYLEPGDEVTFQVTFNHQADSSNPYMYHCHFLEHEDAGMMGQFTVL